MIAQRDNRRCRRRPGFTLTEMMIAILIFGIGLTMAAGLFPAALKLNKSSTANVIGTIIGENALAIAQARLTHGDVPTTMERLDDREIGGKPLIGLRDRTYPVSDSDSQAENQRVMGYLLLGRKLSADVERNDYLLVAVSYRKNDPDNTVELYEADNIDITDYEDVSKADFGNDIPNKVTQNAVIIFEDGRYAYITGLGPNGVAVLDRRLPADKADGWVPYEKEDGGVTRSSPVMAVVVTRTALREEE